MKHYGYNPSSNNDYKDLVSRFNEDQREAYEAIIHTFDEKDQSSEGIHIKDDKIKEAAARAVANGWDAGIIEGCNAEKSYFTLTLASNPDIDEQTIKDLSTRDYGTYERHEMKGMADFFSMYDQLPASVVQYAADCRLVGNHDMRKINTLLYNMFTSKEQLESHFSSMIEMMDHGNRFNVRLYQRDDFMAMIEKHEQCRDEMNLSKLSMALVDQMIEKGYSADEIDHAAELSADHDDLDYYEGEPDVSLVHALYLAVVTEDRENMSEWELQGDTKMDLSHKADIDEVAKVYGHFEHPMDYFKQVKSLNAAYHMGLQAEDIIPQIEGQDLDAYNTDHAIFAYAAIACGLEPEQVGACACIEPSKDGQDPMDIVSQAIDAFKAGVGADEIGPFIQVDALKYFKVQADHNIAMALKDNPDLEADPGDMSYLENITFNPMRDYEKYMGQMIMGLNDGLTPEQVSLYADPAMKGEKRDAIRQMLTDMKEQIDERDNTIKEALNELACYAPGRWDEVKDNYQNYQEYGAEAIDPDPSDSLSDMDER